MVIKHSGPWSARTEEDIAIKALIEAAAAAGAAQVGDARRAIVGRSPFQHDGRQGCFVVVEGGAAPDKNVFAAAAL